MINIDIDKDILENIDIDKGILENIDSKKEILCKKNLKQICDFSCFWDVISMKY